MNLENQTLLENFRRARDDTSFQALYRQCTPRLYAMSVRLLANSQHDAEDMVQETWLRAVRGIESYQQQSKFETWIMGILINVYRELMRKNPSTSTLESIPSSKQPKAKPSQSFIDLERKLAEVPVHYRAVLLLFELEGMDHKQISALLDISIGTSKSRLARARQWLEPTNRSACSQESSS